MGMIPKSHELVALTDDELRLRYDREAEHTVVGTGFYLDELSRRANDRQVEAVRVLTKQMRDMTIAILALTVVNAVLVALSLR
jgi:signal transduction histidine kinase